MSKKVWIIILILAIIAVAAFGIYQYQNQKKQQTVEQPDQPRYVELEKLPERFPADFPLEEGAKIIANYNYEKDGVFQATRQFESRKTLAENYKIYSDYLKTNGWNISANLDLKESKFLTAIKNGTAVGVGISPSPFSKQNLVDISFVFNK